MSDLQESIKQLYNGEISEQEAVEAENNLVGFFKLLRQIDIETRQKEGESE